MLEEAKNFIQSMAKEMIFVLNKKAKLAFANMKGQQFIKFDLLPTAYVKVGRSVSCPKLRFKNEGIHVKNKKLARQDSYDMDDSGIMGALDETIMLGGGEESKFFGGGAGFFGDGESIIGDFGALNSFI